MNTFETPSEFRAAFDALLASTLRQLRLYDHDLSLLEIDHLPRHTALRTLCVAGGGRRVELLLDDISRVTRDQPRLMQLVRDFSHVLEIRQADPDAPRPIRRLFWPTVTACCCAPTRRQCTARCTWTMRATAWRCSKVSSRCGSARRPA